jgi:FMN phosphatase YigB (HAD superfamily)
MRAVLFDLDGTLLDIDINAFFPRYFKALSGTVAGVVDDTSQVEGIMDGIMQATQRAMRPHPGRTNQSVFIDTLIELTGFDLQEHMSEFDRFYEDVFPTLGAEMGPRAGAQEAWDGARATGFKVAVATNPIFPRRAIEHRISWTGIDYTQADVITTYEEMTATKPYAEYYRQTAEMLGVSPSECLMVGDDAGLDMPASDAGMRTFYVGRDGGAYADYRGGLHDLADLLERLSPDA